MTSRHYCRGVLWNSSLTRLTCRFAKRPCSSGPASAHRHQGTHDVFNQSTHLQDFDAYIADPALKRCISHIYLAEQRKQVDDLLGNFGRACGSAEMLAHATAAEKNPPKLKQFDAFGRRIDIIDYHDSYHALMRNSLEAGCAGFAHTGDLAHPHAARAALIYMANQLEPGHCCPVVMTAAAIPVLASLPGYETWARKLSVSGYDGRDVPVEDKAAITAGMSMTEKQGGSDVRANTTLVTPVASGQRGHGCAYTLLGHKWFTSAPMSDAFLTLATTPGSAGPSCFLVPRWLPGGSRNTGFRVMRLKDKLGDRANASSEVEYEHAWATMLGEEGRGVKEIIAMVNSTRLDCALGSAGGMRRAVQLAVWHCAAREAFGAKLVEQPLMRRVLADLCLECDAAAAAAMFVAQLWGQREGAAAAAQDVGGGAADLERAGRVAVAVAKYGVTRRGPGVAFEAMEAVGGNGFVEEFALARLFRHSPLNSIWEGSGNVVCLGLVQSARGIPPLLALLKEGAGGRSAAFDELVAGIEEDVRCVLAGSPAQVAQLQAGARQLADRLSVALAGGSMIRFGFPAADAYVTSRSGAAGFGHSYGSFPLPGALTDEVLGEQVQALGFA